MHQSVRPDGFAGTNSYYTQLAGKVNNPAGGPGSEASGSPLSVIQIFTDKKRAPCLLRGYSALFLPADHLTIVFSFLIFWMRADKRDKITNR